MNAEVKAAQHTQARLEADGTTILIPNFLGVHVAYCHDGSGDGLTDQAEANAKRLVLAWNCHDDLLKALEEAANALEAVGERTWDKRHHDECKSACADAAEMAGGACDEARAAIAKATGAAQ